MANADEPPQHDSIVAASLGLIHATAGSGKVRDLLKHLQLSERQFERRFERSIGVSAKFYSRIVRFQEAVRLMKAGRFERLSDVAYDLGYSDQSHFIKDIRSFTGCTPKRLMWAIQTHGTRKDQHRASLESIRAYVESSGRPRTARASKPTTPTADVLDFRLRISNQRRSGGRLCCSKTR